jgi:hypothetical protein
LNWYNSGTNESAGAQFAAASGVASSAKDTRMRTKSIPHFTEAQQEKFWAKVEVHQPAACWEWTGRMGDQGYGIFGYRETVFNPHRVAYTLLIEPIPDGMVIDHLCRNRRCVNPDHLQVVSHEENTRRGFAPNHVVSRTGVCRRGHTDFRPRYDGDGFYCFSCAAAAKARYKARKKHKATP